MHKDRAADGLRGIAAMNVVLCHLLIAAYPRGFANLYPGSAAPDAASSNLDAVIGAPVLNMLWNGNFAVCVFFVLSGYVLTKAFVDSGSMRSMQVRASRRYLRLSVPILGSVFLAYVVIALGMLHTDAMASVTHSMWLEQFHGIGPSLGTVLREGIYGGIFLGKSTYVPVLWTMKIEFIGSMLVFGFRALEPRGWSGALTGLVVSGALITFFPQDWPLYLGFIAGSYIGQLQTTRNKAALVGILALVVIGGSYDFSLLYDFTARLPMNDWCRKHLFNIIGACALLYLVRCHLLDHLLLSKPAQFLGRISYSLYLVHIPILFSLYAWLFVTLQSTGWRYGAAVLASSSVAIAAAIIVASLFERYVDQMGIKLSQRIYPSTRDAGCRGSKTSASAETDQVPTG